MVAIQAEEERFKAFAFNLYEDEAVRQLLLRLQDAHGLDVPLALFCIWRGVEGRVVAQETMRAAVTFSTRWRESLTQPVRALRREWKGGVAGLPDDLSERARQHVARAEIGIEEIQMAHLSAMQAGEYATEDAVSENLRLYVNLSGISVTSGDIEVLSATVKA